jgi:hypothetical protein
MANYARGQRFSMQGLDACGPIQEREEHDVNEREVERERYDNRFSSKRKGLSKAFSDDAGTRRVRRFHGCFELVVAGQLAKAFCLVL